MSRKSKKGQKKRKGALAYSAAALILFAIYAAIGEWFVHHSRAWLDRYEKKYPELANAIEAVGNPISDLTDGLGLTGHDSVYEYDTAAPHGEVLFAGEPVRISAPAPRDIQVLDRGEFKIGWSPSLRHPVWAAYHVVPERANSLTERPNFVKDTQVPSSPSPDEYKKSGYDKGHMVPNYAMATRYGKGAQSRTFFTSNIAPQTAELNRGPWREIEHRIADLWTESYGEIWVIVGAIGEKEKIGKINVPEKFYALVVAQEGLDVRAFAVLLPQDVDYRTFPARYLISIDDLEELTGLDFLPELPSFIASPLEAQLPTRLWPVKLSLIVKQIVLHYLSE